MKRGRTNIDQARYPMFVTTTITDFIPVFANPQIASKCLQIFEVQRQHFGLSVFAYVLMPSHFHCIIRSSKLEGTSTFMGAWKSLSARMILEYSTHELKRRFADAARRFSEPPRKLHKVWMTRFDDVALYSEDVYATKLNYIHENPVRDGLVEKSEDFEYSSSRAYSSGTPDQYVTLCDMSTGVERLSAYAVARSEESKMTNVPVSPWADRAFGRQRAGQPKG